MSKDRIKIDVEGAKALQAALRDLPLSMQKQVMRPALRAGGKVSLAEIKAKTPVDTGTLKRALKVRAVPRSRVRIGVQIRVEHRAAAAQELGWQAGKRGRKIPGKRYMRAGLYDSSQRAFAVVVQAATAKIPEVIAKAAAKAKAKKG